jgi:hypothetical protein
VFLAQLAKGLHQEAAQPPRCLHVPWGGPPQLDRRRANLDRPARAVGQEDRFRRHLLGQAEEVGGVGSGGLESGAIAAGERAGHGVRGRCEQTEYRVLFREVVHAAGKTANRSLPGEPVQGDVDRLTAAEVQEIAWNEYGSAPPPANAGKCL